MSSEHQVVVVGIGNTIRGDDGVGIYLARALRGVLRGRCEIKELATAGLDVLDAISGYQRAVVIDAIRTPGGVPGEVRRFRLSDFRGSSHMPPRHALDLGQAVALGKRLWGGQVPEVEVLAVETKEVSEFSDALSPELRERFSAILDVVKQRIEEIETGEPAAGERRAASPDRLGNKG